MVRVGGVGGQSGHTATHWPGPILDADLAAEDRVRSDRDPEVAAAGCQGLGAGVMGLNDLEGLGKGVRGYKAERKSPLLKTPTPALVIRAVGITERLVAWLGMQTVCAGDQIGEKRN